MASFFFISGQNVARIDMTDGGMDFEATNGDIFLCARFIYYTLNRKLDLPSNRACYQCVCV